MENLKFTKEYAEILALRNVACIEENAYINGYIKAIEETNAKELLEALVEVISESNRGVSGRLIIDRKLEAKIINAINKATK